MEHEAAALLLYKELLAAVEGRSIMLEEYARQMVYAEELHAGEVDKMLRKSGEIITSGLDPNRSERPRSRGRQVVTGCITADEQREPLALQSLHWSLPRSRWSALIRRGSP
jgi:hypothetical protein